jgi:hypothetical protein
MLVPALILGFGVQSGSYVALSCANFVDARTGLLRTSAGFTVALTVHGEDDHGKNTHLCQADYNLEVTSPDGNVEAAPSNLWSSDDEWNRPIIARIAGFNAAGNLAYILIVEGGKFPSVTAIEYDMKSHNQRNVYPDPAFVRSIAPQCRATLRIAGTLPNGRMVLATSARQGCAREELWELRYEEQPGKHGGTVSLNPIRLASDAAFTPLISGLPATKDR